MTDLNQVPGPYEDTTCQMVAAYGNPNHSQLQTIREFRDNILKSLPGGKSLTKFYYRFTPIFAYAAKQNILAKKLVLLFSAYPAYITSTAGLKLQKGFSSRM